MDRPKIGVGVVIQNADGKILIGKRKGSHSPFYSIPGGHLEKGESFEEAAIKEVLEETGLKIKNPKVFCVTNNMRTYRKENKHYISVNLYTNEFEGEVQLKEPHKCKEWKWIALSEIPEPQFDASEFALECFKREQFYIKDQR